MFIEHHCTGDPGRPTELLRIACEYFWHLRWAEVVVGMVVDQMVDKEGEKEDYKVDKEVTKEVINEVIQDLD